VTSTAKTRGSRLRALIGAAGFAALLGLGSIPPGAISAAALPTATPGGVNHFLRFGRTPTTTPTAGPALSSATPAATPTLSPTATAALSPTATAALSPTATAAVSPTATVKPAVKMGRTVFAYYYPWFSAAPGYFHWAAPSGSRLVGSSIPSLGPYSSRDTAGALDAHMKWLQAAAVDVIIVSWWGQGDYSDGSVKPIMDKAAQYGIKVAFLIDAYSGRTAASTGQDIAYLYAHYGSHPAFFRTVRTTEYGPSAAPRGMFFIYAPSGDGWPAAIDALRGTPNDAIILLRLDDSLLFSDQGVRAVTAASHADGMFNYGHYAYPYQHQQLPSSSDYLLVWAVQPGFDNTLGGGSIVVDRNKGLAYDQTWSPLVQQKPEAVAVDSFNEWGETSQIEPAMPNQSGVYQHLDYDGAYGLTGASAATAYIARTAYWAAAYKQ
jgi:hypothetical protein